jgi:DNA-binding transcriptional LysR family regulator
MEIWQLNTFRVVAKNLHFTKASQELNLTQSAVSYQIKSLEEELGVKLFNRNKRKITLTSKGETVLDYANKMLHQVEVMKHEIKENRENLKGELKIVIVTRSLDSPFPRIRKDFCKKYEDIQLSLQTVLDTEDVLDHIRKGNADIGFTVKNAMNIFDFDGLLTIPHGVFEMLFVVGKDHPFAGKKKISLEDLKDEEWILFEPGSWLRNLTDKIFKLHNFLPKNIYETNDGAVIRSMVKNGEGISLLPGWGILDALKSGTLISLKPKNVIASIQANIVVLSAQRSKLVSAFIDYMLEKRLEGFRFPNEISK